MAGFWQIRKMNGKDRLPFSVFRLFPAPQKRKASCNAWYCPEGSVKFPLPGHCGKKAPSHGVGLRVLLSSSLKLFGFRLLFRKFFGSTAVKQDKIQKSLSHFIVAFSKTFRKNCGINQILLTTSAIYHKIVSSTRRIHPRHICRRESQTRRKKKEKRIWRHLHILYHR